MGGGGLMPMGICTPICCGRSELSLNLHVGMPKFIFKQKDMHQNL